MNVIIKPERSQASGRDLKVNMQENMLENRNKARARNLESLAENEIGDIYLRWIYLMASPRAAERVDINERRLFDITIWLLSKQLGCRSKPSLVLFSGQ